jgi:hypothetical protein
VNIKSPPAVSSTNAKVSSPTETNPVFSVYETIPLWPFKGDGDAHLGHSQGSARGGADSAYKASKIFKSAYFSLSVFFLFWRAPWGSIIDIRQ